jgi:uncharacterized protein
VRALLDVNVLVALLETEHVEHRRARDWMRREIFQGWASCAITENGFVRVVAQPSYPRPIVIADAVERLRRATATEHHRFWTCETSVLDEQRIDPTRLQGARQVTDIYLLALATANGGRLVTFDRTIPLPAVRGAGPENLVVL